MAPPTTSRCASSARIPGSGSTRSARACRTSASRCCCGAQHRRLHALPGGRRRGFRPGGGRRGHRHLPHLRRAQRRRPDASRDRGRARDAARWPRGDVLLRRSARPGRGPTRSTITCASPSASSRAGAHILAIKDMAGLLRARCCTQARRGAARALPRDPDPRAHARHARRPTRDAPGVCPSGGRRGRRGQRPDGRHDQPTVALSARRRHGEHDVRHRPVARSGERPRALLGGRSQRLQAVRVRASGADRQGLHGTRYLAASSRTCASRRSRSGWVISSRRSRTGTRPPTEFSGGRRR